MKRTRIYILLVIFLGLGAIVSAGTMLTFVGIDLGSINQKFSEVTFRAKGNDFMGSIFWLNTKNIETGEVITINGQGSKTCFKQVKGIYYNSQRGNRLRPLDNDTLTYFKGSSTTYDDLILSGGLFTSCSGDEYSIYGMVTYHVVGDSYDSHIVAGTKYNWDANTISGVFSKSLQRFDNKYPIGYIYDDRGGGIGFVGGKGNAGEHESIISDLNNGSGINNLFTYNAGGDILAIGPGFEVSTTAGNAINTLMNAGIQGTIGLSFSVGTVEKNTILGNFDRKTLIFNALNVNFSKLMNVVKKNAENLCKGKYEDPDTVDFSTKNLFCLDFSLFGLNDFITINQNEWTNLKDKTIVVKNGDIRIAGSMGWNEGPVSIFIDKGNLLVVNNTGSMIGFDKNGYPTSSNGVTKGFYLNGNFIINGLIIGADNPGNKAAFSHKLFLNGKFASLNTPNYPSLGRTDQMTALFGNNANNAWIRLGKVFTRECNPISGTGSDNISSCRDPSDRNAMLPLIIIDGYYPSNLIQ